MRTLIFSRWCIHCVYQAIKDKNRTSNTINQFAPPDQPHYLEYTIRETMAIRADASTKIARDEVRLAGIPAKPFDSPIGFESRTDVVKRRESVPRGDFSHLLDSREDTDFQALRDACHAALTTYIAEPVYEAQEQGMCVYRPAAKPAKWRVTYLPVFHSDPRLHG